MGGHAAGVDRLARQSSIFRFSIDEQNLPLESLRHDGICRGQQQRGAAILQHKFQPLRREFSIQRQIGAARHHDAQHPHNHRHTPVGQQAYNGAVFSAMVPNSLRQHRRLPE